MNNLTTQTSADTNVTKTLVTGSLSPLPTQAETTIIQAITTAAPTNPHSGMITAVIVVIVLTVIAMGLLLCWYLCRNKGDYRTTGELAPGEDPDEEFSNQTRNDKKEYFI